jgi:arylsulfatase A-like enzyme
MVPGCLADVQESQTSGRGPNILFLFTDDQRFSAIGALGIEDVKTPNIDRLVRGGTAFTHAHIMGSDGGAVCMPSRAMVLSGRDLFSLDKSKGWYGSLIPKEHVTLPEVLRGEGYETFFTGKWHQDRGTLKRGFSEGDNIFFGGMTYEPFGAKFSHYDSAKGEFESFTAEKHTSEMIADAAVDFLRQQKDCEKPFFAMASFLAPHDPREAPGEYHALYEAGDINLAPNFMPEHPFDNGELKIRDEKLAVIIMR